MRLAELSDAVARSVAPRVINGDRRRRSVALEYGDIVAVAPQ
jgi:hypothetical protein